MVKTLVKWETSKAEIPAVVGAFLLLVGWLAAAIILYRNHTFVPLNYFDRSIGNPNSWLHATTSNGIYNTFISVIGSLVGAAIGYGIGCGFKAMLRRDLLRKKGVSLYTYEAVVKYAAVGLQLKLRWTAVVALLLFASVQLLGGATQAAFGSSLDTMTMHVRLRAPRLTDNIPLFLQSNGWAASALANSGTAGGADNFPAAAYSAAANRNPDPEIAILGTVEHLHLPFFSAEPIRQILSLDESKSDWASTFTRNERDLVAASGQNIMRTEVEAFTANATCEAYQIGGEARNDTTSGLTRYDFTFPCGKKTALYDLSDATSYLADAYACPDGTPNVYYIFISPSSPGEPAGFECSVSAASALLPIAVNHQSSSAVPAGSGSYPVAIPDSLQLVKNLGINVLNNFGHSGWPRMGVSLLQLTDGVTDGEVAYARYVAYFETLTESLAKWQLAQASNILSVYLWSDSSNPVSYVSREGTVLVQALRIHLRGYLLAWLIIPVVLILILVYSSFFVFVGNSGQTDFTDPVSTALIGIGSEDVNAVRGASTGEFPGPSKFWRKDGTDLRKIWLAFGEKPGGGRLQFTAETGAVGHFQLPAPKAGSFYE
ncbi:hypothetical protein JCM6882_004729 [Rhodosporidiobolus microsporus]